MVRSLLLAVASAALVATSSAQDCKPIKDVLSEQADAQIFYRAIQAVDFEFSPDLKYTVLATVDGPEGANIPDGEGGFGGLLRAYGFDTSSVETMKANQYAPLLAGFIKYSIIPGGYPLSALSDRTPLQQLRTLWDPVTEGYVCSDPDGAATYKTSDGDLKVEMVEGGTVIGLTDDSPSTATATITSGDIPACGGSIVHLVAGVLNPCCSEDSTDCDSAELDEQQKNPLADPPATTTAAASGTTTVAASGTTTAAASGTTTEAASSAAPLARLAALAAPALLLAAALV